MASLRRQQERRETTVPDRPVVIEKVAEPRKIILAAVPERRQAA